MDLPIYLDYNATTPLDGRVLERMAPFFTQYFGNASSKGHAYGWAAQEAVEQAREEVASLLGAEPAEIFFTSGATESVNLALKGAAATYERKGRHIVTVETEHSAVIESCRALERDGLEVTVLPVGRDGRIDLDRLADALRQDTILVSVMWANNETGVLQPIDEIARLIRPRGILFMTDATQAAGKMAVSAGNVDLMACSAHKFYGPKGVGALFVRRRDPRVRLIPLIDGGGQENGLRGGTLNVPGIVGMGAAADLALAEHPAEEKRLRALRDRIEHVLSEEIGDITINGAGVPRLPQTSSITFHGVRSGNLITGLRDLAMSAGSACSSGTGRPSRVLKAMGLSDEEALSTLRLSLGRFTTEADVDTALEQIVAAVKAERVRA